MGIGPPRLGAVLAQRAHAVEGARSARGVEGTTVVRIRFRRKERARAIDVSIRSGSGERATVYVGAALDEGLDPGRLLLPKQLPSQRSPLLVRGMSSSYEFRAGSQHLQRTLGQPYERCLYFRSSVPSLARRFCPGNWNGPQGPAAPCGFACSFEGHRQNYGAEGSPPQTEAADGGRAGGRAVEKE